jgi:hypothetical protein
MDTDKTAGLRCVQPGRTGQPKVTDIVFDVPTAFGGRNKCRFLECIAPQVAPLLRGANGAAAPLLP